MRYPVVETYPFTYYFKDWAWNSKKYELGLDKAGLDYEYDPGYFFDHFVVRLKDNQDRLLFNNLVSSWR